MDILVLLIHPLDNLHSRFGLAISLWPVWGRRYMFKGIFRSKLLVLTADKLWTIVRDEALWYPKSCKVRLGQLYYCCSECVGQNIDFDPVTVMASRDQMPFSFPHENVLADHGPWAVWNTMANMGSFGA